ncbi:MAG: CoA transferase [Myxococcales bacterium]|nr:CoA transferase [Myxococcales bacterium]MCB9582953.1 CoA transferase [Polyangiaceae bacterium]
MAALDHVRILDLTRLLPGPFATLVLADLGAQVDKIEDLGAGDYLRHTPPMVGDLGTAFHVLNRGKRSAALDLKSPAGVSALKRLVRHYDVVFEQFRPGVLERLGVGHQTLLGENERLVICALTGYGQDGPLRDRAGHDINYMARAGLLGLQGPAEAKPQLPSFQLADVSGGLWSVIAIQAALFERERTGKGRVIDIAMLDSVIPFATVTLSRLLGGELPSRGQELLTGGIAPYDTYATQDGEAISLGALEPKFLMKFCASAGIQADMSALLPGPHQAALKARFTEVFASRTRAEWEAFNAEHDVCLEPVLRPDELRADPQLSQRGVFFDAPVGDASVGLYRTPITDKAHVPSPAPRHGEHTDAIFAEAGFSAEEIAELRAAGAIR